MFCRGIDYYVEVDGLLYWLHGIAHNAARHFERNRDIESDAPGQNAHYNAFKLTD